MSLPKIGVQYIFRLVAAGLRLRFDISGITGELLFSALKIKKQVCRERL